MIENYTAETIRQSETKSPFEISTASNEYNPHGSQFDCLINDVDCDLMSHESKTTSDDALVKTYKYMHAHCNSKAPGYLSNEETNLDHKPLNAYIQICQLDNQNITLTDLNNNINNKSSTIKTDDHYTNKFQFALMAATSPAIKVNEETLTYLNQGQNYELRLSYIDFQPTNFVNNSTGFNYNYFPNDHDNFQSNLLKQNSTKGSDQINSDLKMSTHIVQDSSLKCNLTVKKIDHLACSEESDKIVNNIDIYENTTSRSVNHLNTINTCNNSINSASKDSVVSKDVMKNLLIPGSNNIVFMSIIRLCFWDRKLQEIEHEEIKEWEKEYQNTRMLEIDSNSSFGVIEVRLPSAFINTAEIIWNGKTGANIFFRCNCTSTAFAPHKHGGEKGIHMRFQIDTYEISLVNPNLKYLKSSSKASCSLNFPTEYAVQSASSSQTSLLSPSTSTSSPAKLLKEDLDSSSSNDFNYSSNTQSFTEDTRLNFKYLCASYCRIQLFRLKGAQRKLKTDKSKIDRLNPPDLRKRYQSSSKLTVLYNSSFDPLYSLYPFTRDLIDTPATNIQAPIETPSTLTPQYSSHILNEYGTRGLLPSNESMLNTNNSGNVTYPTSGPVSSPLLYTTNAAPSSSFILNTVPVTNSSMINTFPSPHYVPQTSEQIYYSGGQSYRRSLTIKDIAEDTSHHSVLNYENFIHSCGEQGAGESSMMSNRLKRTSSYNSMENLHLNENSESNYQSFNLRNKVLKPNMPHTTIQPQTYQMPLSVSSSASSSSLSSASSSTSSVASPYSPQSPSYNKQDLHTKHTTTTYLPQPSVNKLEESMALLGNNPHQHHQFQLIDHENQLSTVVYPNVEKNIENLTTINALDENSSIRSMRNEGLPNNSSNKMVEEWLLANRFCNLIQLFTGYSSNDILRMSKEDMIALCGASDGIRVYNLAHNIQIRPKLTIFVTFQEQTYYSAIFLTNWKIDFLIKKIVSLYSIFVNADQQYSKQTESGAKIVIKENHADHRNEDDDDNSNDDHEENDNNNEYISNHKYRSKKSRGILNTNSNKNDQKFSNDENKERSEVFKDIINHEYELFLKVSGVLVKTTDEVLNNLQDQSKFSINFELPPSTNRTCSNKNEHSPQSTIFTSNIIKIIMIPLD